MSEFAPAWSNARMTKSQIRKYIKEMEEAEKLAKQKIKEAKASWDLEKEKKELNELEKELDNL